MLRRPSFSIRMYIYHGFFAIEENKANRLFHIYFIAIKFRSFNQNQNRCLYFYDRFLCFWTSIFRYWLYYYVISIGDDVIQKVDWESFYLCFSCCGFYYDFELCEVGGS